jgi:two-component system phosphate regulon sensor histidine kinase PhoR
MWRSRLSWKLLMPYAAVGVATVLAVVIAAPRWPERRWLVGVVAAAVMLGACAWLVRAVVAALESLASTADAIAAGEHSGSFALPRRDAVGGLTESLDRMDRAARERLAQARKTAELLSTVLGGMDQGVIAIGADRSLLVANAAARHLLDLPVQPPDGAPLAKVLPDVRLRQAALQVLKQPAPHSLTLESDGTTERVIGVEATPMPGTPCPGVVFVLHDETELRRLETLRQEFVANVSHELKTPLASIKAYAETLSQGAIHDPQNNLRFVRRIEEQADRLHQLILDLLRLARIEAGEQSFEIAAVPIGLVVEACLADHASAAAARSIELRGDETERTMQVRADAEGLRQILDNLVDNAIKYTPEGGTVSIRWSRHGRMVRIEVRDTGIGIPRELQPRVFERFFRVDTARSRELGGTGLGLSIVKHLAQSFGGSVSVESQPGKGSTFAVELPAA